MNVKTDANIHTSVLLEELVSAVTIHHSAKNIIVDCTLGLAGHASQVIQKMNPGDIFIGFDADERNLMLAQERLEALKTKTKIVLIHSNFEHLREELAKHDIHSITGIYYDLGVSSMHFDQAERGFSLRLDGPLDMRFNTRSGKTAADVLNYSEEKDLFQIFKEYGEEPHCRKIAARVITARKQKKFQTTTDLNDFLDSEINSHIKTKTRVFQALRIEVNGELDTLKGSLSQAIELLGSGGNIFVISFHSLEDRITKQTFKRETRDCICSDIICQCGHKKSLKLINKKPILPGAEEQKTNSRSRSAKARHAQKI
ncbi:16S rRNA (cytosine(1402)-N(4))-methyltransferase RsmH [Candidatus Gracilibacteria bacterium]|nr:16S rRNA (cytosine(1402)-N(4))-methyltransferase RsmH [Candidatus Gracilibacteria bacterium]